MTRIAQWVPVVAAAAVMMAGLGAMSQQAGAQSVEELSERLLALEREIEFLKSQIAEVGRTAEAAAAEAKSLDPAQSKWHLAGYASSGARVTDAANDPDTFLAGKFNPVFHYQYRDIVLFEGELEFEVESDGKTGVELEYATIDLLLHDAATLVAGKFLSPIGQFQERLHPDWINKLPDRPAGFGAGGVQPLSDVGLMLRGGFRLAPLSFGYSVFAANGPQVELEGGELEAFELEGFGSDDTNDIAFGGRIGVLLWPYFELGGSFMTSDVEGKKQDDVTGAVSEGEYTLWGVDVAYTRGGLGYSGGVSIFGIG